MKRILLAMFLVVAMLMSVGSVSAVATWTCVDPYSFSFNEDATPDPTLDLSTCATGTTLTYAIQTDSLDASKVSANLPGGSSVVTFTPVADENGNGGSVVFLITDTSDATTVVPQVDVTINAVDDAAVWSTLSDQGVEENSVDGTTVYPNVKTQCTDIDSPITMSVTSSHTNYDLAVSGDNLVINNLESDWNDIVGETVDLDCNGISASFKLTVTPVTNVYWVSIPSDKSWLHDKTTTIDIFSNLADVSVGNNVGVTGIHFTGSGTCTSTQCIVTINPESGWAGYEDVTFWVNDGTQKDALDVTRLTVTNTNPIAIGTDPSAITTVEDTYVSIILKASDGDGDSLTYSVADLDKPTYGSLSSIIKDSITGYGKVTYTPNLNYHGSDSFSFKVSDGVAERSKAVSIMISSFNDAPTLSVSDYVVQEGIPVVITLVTASEAVVSDIDGDSVSYSLVYDTVDGTKPEDSTFDKDKHFAFTASAGAVISGWTPDKKDTGELKLKLIASDGVLSTTDPFILNVYPRYMCEAGKIGTFFSVDIDNPGDDDDFGPGDTITIEVTVENDAGEDKDVIVEAILYDTETHKKIAEVESDDENVDEDGLTFELEIELPIDSDEDWKGTYVLYVKAYEDGEEDSQCVTSLVDLDIGRKKNRIIVNDVILSPLSVDAGETVDITIDILSIGKKDQENVYVRVMNSDLDLDLQSDKISLDEYDGTEVAHIFKFKNVEIPKSADSGNHALNIVVYYDGNSEKYSDSPTYEAIDGENVLTVKGTVLAGVVEVAEIEPATDGVYSIPMTVTNTGDAGRFTLSLEGVEDFAEPVESKTFLLSTGGSSTKHLEFVLLEDVEAQEYAIDAVLTTVDGQEVVRESFIIDLTEEGLGVAKKGSGWLSSKTFWIVGDIVLIIVAIFFLKMIFGGRKPDVQEVKL